MEIRHFSTASREEIDVELQIKEGKIPDDMCGFIFMNTAAGTVNSGGLPYPELNPDGTYNEEYTSPLINGDGNVYRFDLSTPGVIRLKTGLMKPPCYYADLATAYSTKDNNPYYDLHFINSGIARMSPILGCRDQLNTAITPMRFKKDNQLRLLANFDAARAFEFDPKNLNIVTAIGENKTWLSGLPPELFEPFPMLLSSAHPVFDPDTEELFTVNFTKTIEALMASTTIMRVLFADMDWFIDELKKLIEKLIGQSKQEQLAKVKEFFNKAHRNAPSHNRTWWQRFWNFIKKIFDKWFYKYISNPNAVYLIKWNGTKELQRWEIVDENGESIQIQHNMHQISMSKDYVILGDTNFKFTLDVMFVCPFWNDPDLDKFLRELLTGPMNDYSTMYIVKRSDLVPGVKKVKAVKTVLPEETVHFSANYENPGNIITVHTAHNCSACAAEWIRSYDTRQIDDKLPIDKEFMGLVSIGEVDISKIGKCVINAETGELIEPDSVFLELTGDLDKADPGPHTWAIGLYTYNGMLSPEKNVAKIEYVYWQAYGLHRRWLTEFIYNLYKDPKRNRTFSAEEMENFTRQGAPFVLECIDTNVMKAVDHYTFPPEHFYWSLQFAPKNENTEGVPEGKNGYILTTVVCGVPAGNEQFTYLAEIWIFDANNLAAGPLCKLDHPDMSFGFTIHSVWMPRADAVTIPDYTINVEEDYNYMINQIKDQNTKSRVQQLFNEYVYPNFPS